MIIRHEQNEALKYIYLYLAQTSLTPIEKVGVLEGIKFSVFLSATGLIEKTKVKK